MIEWLRRPKLRFRLALGLFFASIIGWPLTALTVARHEPQFILGLSWLALTLTALDVLATTDVRRQHEDADG